MFAVYDKGSINAINSIENLYNTKQVTPARETDKYANKELSYEDYTSQHNENTQKQNLTKQAIGKYKKNTKMDTQDIVYHVYQIIDNKCISINNLETIQDAYNLLVKQNISQLPIVNNNNTIIGMIDKKYILNLLMENLNNPTSILNQQLNQIDLPKTITTNPITDIRRIAKVMIDLDIHAMPVVDDSGILVGIVSQTDIIKAVSSIPNLQLWA